LLLGSDTRCSSSVEFVGIFVNGDEDNEKDSACYPSGLERVRRRLLIAATTERRAHDVNCPTTSGTHGADGVSMYNSGRRS
jgi:hypothetical protein